MSNAHRYWRGVKRRLQARRCQRAFQRSAKPLACIDKTYVTLFFDYEGKWSHINFDSNQDKHSRKGMACILEILGQAKFQATFNCVGKLIEDHYHYDILEQIAQAGHEIASHTSSHTLVDRWPAARVVEDMAQYRSLLQPIVPKVIGFRAPQSRWRACTLQGLLQSRVLWNAESDVSPFPYVIAQLGEQRLWRMPVTIDDWALEGHGIHPSVMREAWCNAVKSAAEQIRYVSIGFHPWVLGKDSLRLDVFSQFIDFLSGCEDTEIATFEEIARICETKIAEDF